MRNRHTGLVVYVALLTICVTGPLAGQEARIQIRDWGFSLVTPPGWQPAGPEVFALPADSFLRGWVLSQPGGRVAGLALWGQHSPSERDALILATTMSQVEQTEGATFVSAPATAQIAGVRASQFILEKPGDGLRSVPGGVPTRFAYAILAWGTNVLFICYSAPVQQFPTNLAAFNNLLSSLTITATPSPQDPLSPLLARALDLELIVYLPVNSPGPGAPDCYVLAAGAAKPTGVYILRATAGPSAPLTWQVVPVPSEDSVVILRGGQPEDYWILPGDVYNALPAQQGVVSFGDYLEQCHNRWAAIAAAR